MTTKNLLLVSGCCLLVTLLPNLVSAQNSTLIADGAELQTLSTEFKFTEGPAADRDGNVYFTDQPNDRIMKWSIDGTMTTFLSPCGRSNGLYFDLDGSLLACADEKNELWDIELDGTHTVVVDQYDGKLLNGPNDLWVRPDGGIYFTDPLYKRPYWNRGPTQQTGQCVYFINKDRSSVTRVADSLTQPNGIVGTADGKTLYIADIGGKKTFKFTINDDGSLSDQTLFCELGSDGMTIDAQGNVYLTGKGVTVFDPSGTQIKHIDVPQGWTANVCFGGEEFDTLFITASQGFYSLKMNVSGGAKP